MLISVLSVVMMVLELVLLKQVVDDLELLTVHEVVKHTVVRRPLQDVVLVGLP